MYFFCPSRPPLTFLLDCIVGWPCLSCAETDRDEGHAHFGLLVLVFLVSEKTGFFWDWRSSPGLGAVTE